jgi:hypothetical protein
MKRPPLFVSFAIVLLASTGCISSRYKSAGEDFRSPVLLNLTSGALAPDAGPPPAIDATVHMVIAFHGPGSWKREAYWDEYILSVVNRGTTPLTLDSAALTDFQAHTFAAGTDPWAIEKESHRYRSDVRATRGAILEIGNGAVRARDDALTTGANVTGAYLGISVAGMAMTANPIGLPIYALGSVFLNTSRRQHIEEQFDRRRLKLPLTLAPGATAQGSLFFRIAPGPQRLVLRGTAGDQLHETTIALAPLAGLHLKASTVTQNFLP